MKIINHIRVKINKLFIASVFWMMLSLLGLAQPVVNIQSLASCEGFDVDIPIEVLNFDDIAAFTLYIRVDTSNISFLGIEDIHQELSSGELVSHLQINDSASINLSWAGNLSANIESGILCNLKIKLKSLSANFDFKKSCELAKSDFTIIANAVYNNGTLVSINNLNSEPDILSVAENQSCNFILPSLKNINYQWQIKEDENWININNNSNFLGSNTNKLIIVDAPPSISFAKFRCLITNNDCTSVTTESLLIVSGLGVSDNNGHELKIFPNPVGDILNYTIVPNLYEPNFKLFDINGKMILQSEILPNTSLGSLSLVGLKDGMYFLYLYEYNNIIAQHKIIKKY